MSAEHLKDHRKAVMEEALNAAVFDGYGVPELIQEFDLTPDEAQRISAQGSRLRKARKGFENGFYDA